MRASLVRRFLLTFSALVGVMLHAQGIDEVTLEEILDQPVPRYENAEKLPLRQALEGIGRSYMVPIVIQDGVEGDSQLNVNNTTVRGLITMLCKPGNYFWESDDGYVFVRRTKTVIYAVDYPQNTRSSSDSASVTLGGNTTGSNGSYGSNGGSVQQVTASSMNNGANGSSGGAGADTTSVSVSGENKVEFWEKLEEQLGKMVTKDETVVMNKFAGLIEVDASLNAHARISSFLNKLNCRIGRQIEIKAKILEVTLNDQSKLGIDWDVAAFSIGGGGGANVPRIGGEFTDSAGNTFSRTAGSTLAGITGLADGTLPGATFASTISSGKVSALVQALSQQGNVRSQSAPRVNALNNQTAYIKIAEERTFWQQQNNLNVYGTGDSTPVVVTNYTPQSISIGNFLKIVAQVTDTPTPEDAIITLDVMPVLTKLRGESRSPDGRSNAPVLDVQQASTMVRLKHGESAIIGGFQTWTSADGRRAIPGLGSLPVIGRAFRTDAKSEVLTELVIILTATVVEPGSSAPVEIDDVLKRDLRSGIDREEAPRKPVAKKRAKPVKEIRTQAVTVPDEQ